MNNILGKKYFVYSYPIYAGYLALIIGFAVDKIPFNKFISLFIALAIIESVYIWRFIKNNKLTLNDLGK